MYIRTATRTNKDGSRAQYAQLAHNYRDERAGQPRSKILYNFGRLEQLDQSALKRLVLSISRLMSAEDALECEQLINNEQSDWTFAGSRVLGGAWFLDKLWDKLGIKRVFQELLHKRKYAIPIERAIFAMVANRALNPLSKLSVEDWVGSEVIIPELNKVDVHQLYRAMDFLLESCDQIQEQVFWSVANVLNLEVDIIFFDTTTAYFEIEQPDEFRKRERIKTVMMIHHKL